MDERTYLDEVTLPGPDHEDGGAWLVCDHCDRSWRPSDEPKHEGGCPVAEVLELRRRNEQLEHQLTVEASQRGRLRSMVRDLDVALSGVTFMSGPPGAIHTINRILERMLELIDGSEGSSEAPATLLCERCRDLLVEFAAWLRQEKPDAMALEGARKLLALVGSRNEEQAAELVAHYQISGVVGVVEEMTRGKGGRRA